MKRWITGPLPGLALWLIITLTLQAFGVSVLTAHLLAAVAAFAVAVVVTRARAARTSASPR